MNTETHIVPQQNTPIRMQEYGVGIFNTLPTRSSIKKALKKNWIYVNDCPATTATFITGGETITFKKPNIPSNKKELIFPLRLAYEDDYIAVIHKPAGILVSGNSFKTISSALAQNIHPSPAKDATKPQPAHRLDYPTTGLLLIGKTSSAIIALNRLFEEDAIQKTYLAVAMGSMNNSGQISTEIDGKYAKSEFKVIHTIASKRFEQLHLVKLSPKTGRTHQLRKHLASQGNPILGDQKYGKEQLILKGKGLFLHAYSLQFKHPFTHKELKITSEIPKRFSKLFPEIDID